MSAEHVVSVRLYIGVWVTLLIFTGLTTGVAYIDLGVFNTVVALAIAVAKMLLVVLFFMHVKYTTGIPRVVMVAALLWLAIMMSITLADELTRGWAPVARAWGSGTLLPILPHLLR